VEHKSGTLTLPDGRTVFCREWLPDGVAYGVIVCLHGVESHSHWFQQIVPELVRAGHAVWAFDRPGWGESEGPPGHLGSVDEALELLALLSGSLRRQYGTVHLVGLSWGGLYALYAALRRGFLFDTVTLLAPGIFAKKDIAFADRLFGAWAFLRGRADAERLPLRIDPEDFTRRFDKREFIYNDPLRVREVTVRFGIETMKMRAFVRESAGLRRPPDLQCLLAGQDRIVDNRRTERLLARYGARVAHYDGQAHSLVYEQPGRVGADVAEFIADQGAPEGWRVMVVGAGAVGGAVAGLLAARGVPVTLVGRARQVKLLRERGLRLRLGEGRRRLRRALTFVHHPRDAEQPPDLAILAVKSHQTLQALEDLKSVVTPATVLCSLQNGVGNEALVREVFPENPCLAGIISAYIEAEGPDRVRVYDDRGGLAAAAAGGDAERARRAWEAVLPHTGLETRFLEGKHAPLRIKWSKLVLNVAFNALNAATGKTPAEILRDRETGALAIRALRETFAVMRKKKIRPVDLPGSRVRALRRVVRLPVFLARRLLARPLEGKPAGPSSTRQDLLRGRERTEIAEMNGLVVRLGKELRVKTPANAAIVERLAAAREEAGAPASSAPASAHASAAEA
jgi:2-dehydropantoate 2-reductase